MEVPVRIVRCDTAGCRSYSDLGPVFNEEVIGLLVNRGWKVVPRAGKPSRHYCPVHHGGAARLEDSEEDASVPVPPSR